MTERHDTLRLIRDPFDNGYLFARAESAVGSHSGHGADEIHASSIQRAVERVVPR